MKKSNFLISMLASLMVFSACGKTKDKTTPANTDSGSITDPTSVIDIDDIVVDDDDEEEEEDFEHKTCDPIYHGSIGGAFIETSIGRALESNSSYVFSFKPSTTLDSNYTVYSDDPTIAQIQRQEGSEGFTLKTVLQGDAIITAYDSNEMLVLRSLVKVRNPKSKEACAKKLFSTPKFRGLYYGATLAFTGDNPLVGVCSADDDGFETTYIEFVATNCRKAKMFDDNFNYWLFDMEVNQDTSATSRSFVGMYVSVTLDIIMIYYSEGLFDMFQSNN